MTPEELVGTWTVINPQDKKTGAQLVLRDDGSAIIKNWPGEWVRLATEQSVTLPAKWNYLDLNGDAPLAELLTSRFVDGNKSVAPMLNPKTTVFGRRCLQIVVRDPDEGLPTFCADK